MLIKYIALGFPNTEELFMHEFRENLQQNIRKLSV
ncbi:hypothetical protein T11_8369 [Trichinella zimbabwensis]|uniref:Uncharacterized protein n=1 Tax=Trichinella zimbabwensis TaxID=268475 RepID=A0A0V1GLB7_9BILA|nr:hypothetical protein T11_8369 [Trichinella zimbabwensis]